MPIVEPNQEMKDFITNFFNQSEGVVETAVKRREEADAEKEKLQQKIRDDREALFKKCIDFFTIMMDREWEWLSGIDSDARFQADHDEPRLQFTVPSILQTLAVEIIHDAGAPMPRVCLHHFQDDMLHSKAVLMDDSGAFVSDKDLYQYLATAFSALLYDFVEQHFES